MLAKFSELKGCHLESRDGTIGRIKDLFFDDESWTIRYLVADTGNWLTGRRVLLSPRCVIGGGLDEHHKLPVNLTRQQIESSPGVEADQPVSEQHQRDLHAYYGWQPYWGIGPYPVAGVLPVAVPPPPDGAVQRDARTAAPAGDPHLRSANQVLGYSLLARDGGIGHVEDFLVHLEDWTMRALVVDTKNWLPGRKVLLSPASVDRVSWSDTEVAVHLNRDAVKESPEYRADRPLDPAFEQRLADYYHELVTGS